MGLKGMTPHNFEDLSGKRFGRLIVISKTKKKKDNTTRWKCKCDCGNITETTRTSLIRGKSRSCGCLARELASKRSKKYNRYKLFEDYGIGYASNTNKEFYFDVEDYEKIKDYCWYEGRNGYFATRNPTTERIEYFHTMIMDSYDSEKVTDHINRCRNDNRKANLRLVTEQQNSINKSIQSNNKSGVPGVHYDKAREKWVGSLTLKGHKYFKRFKNKSDAVEYRHCLEIIHFKEFAPNLHKEAKKLKA